MLLIIYYYIDVMDLFDLKIFATILEEGSATAAAKHLHMTQPGVSQHIGRLEAEMGQRLFERKGKRLVLSDFGRLFLVKAKELLEKADRLKNLSSEVLLPTGTLKLGLTDASTMTVIPPALAEFRKLYPTVKIKLDVDDSGDIEERVLRGYYDLGIITAGEKSHPLLDVEVLYHDRIDALVSRRSPLAKKKRVSLAALAREPLLIYPRRSRTRQLIDAVFHERGIVPREIIDVYINTAAAKLAEVQMGVALLSEAFIEGELPKQMCSHVRIEGDPFKRAICIVRKKDVLLFGASNYFYQILLKQKEGN